MQMRCWGGERYPRGWVEVDIIVIVFECEQWQQNYLRMQKSKNARSKSANHNLNSLLSIQTPSFIHSYQFLQTQTVTPFWKPPIAQMPINAIHKHNFLVQATPNQTQEPQKQRPLLKNKTAINQLQQLMTPRAQNLTSFGNLVENVKLVNSVQPLVSSLNDIQPQHVPQDKPNQQKIRAKYQQQLRHCEQELAKVNTLLSREHNRQRQSSSLIAGLQNEIKKVHQQKSEAEFLFRKLQHQHNLLEQKYKDLEQKLKKRIIVNLELESLMISINMKNDQKVTELKSVISSLQLSLSEKEKYYQAQLKQLRQQFQAARKKGQQQIDSLISQLNKRSRQLAELKAKQKISIFDSQPLFDKFGISTKNSHYFMEPPVKNEQKQNVKNNRLKKQGMGLNQLVPEQQETQENLEIVEPRLQMQSLNLESFKLGKNRPFCQSERL